MEDNPYEGLRSLALSVDPAKLGFQPTPEFPDVFGVVADLELHGTATLVCFVDGTTSLYYSSGGGAIGLGQHESIARESLAFLASVQAGLGAFSTGLDTSPLTEDQYRFTALTFGGHRTLTAAESELRASTSGGATILHGFHAVIGAYRLWSETQGNGAR